MKIFLYCISILMILFPLQGIAAPLKSPIPALKPVTSRVKTTVTTSNTGNSTPKEVSKAAPAKKTIPKPSLVQPPPASQQFLTAPTPVDFKPTFSQAGKYQLQLPLAFGNNPFAPLTSIDDISLVYTDGKHLLATNILDANDSYHYRSNLPLPDFSDSRPLLVWQLPSQGNLLWTCKLSKLENFQGNRYILKASAPNSEKKYEILFIVPSKDFLSYLPAMLYSISSFSL